MIQTYSERLILAMQRRGVNVTTLAKAVGLTYQGVKRVVDGQSKAFTAANNEEAARYLGVSPGWLATGKGDMEGAGVEQSSIWPFDSITQQQYSSLSSRDKRLIENVVKVMLEENKTTPPSPKPDIQTAMDRVASLGRREEQHGELQEMRKKSTG